MSTGIEMALLRVGPAPSFPCSPAVHTDEGVGVENSTNVAIQLHMHPPCRGSNIIAIPTILKGSFAVLLGHRQAAKAFAMTDGTSTSHVRRCRRQAGGVHFLSKG